jgi:hypothetical protein
VDARLIGEVREMVEKKLSLYESMIWENKSQEGEFFRKFTREKFKKVANTIKKNVEIVSYDGIVLDVVVKDEE